MTESTAAERVVEFIPPSHEVRKKIKNKTRELGLLRSLLKLAVKAELEEEVPPDVAVE